MGSRKGYQKNRQISPKLFRSISVFIESVTMAPSVKMAALVAALIVFASAQAQGTYMNIYVAIVNCNRIHSNSRHGKKYGLAGWAIEAAAADMVPVSPAQRVTVVIPGGASGVGTLAAPLCMQCRCCSRSNPAHCVATTCCSAFNCNTAGKCNLVQQKCGCSGCGGAN